ncbi:hypothetical protein BDV27DRAFT_50818 [Aspergillus caelatus]|uniref:Uncharacterized protein n=2 Tax=Aspergillus subgen. Circumdati TaxID=2720871 RepID=A0A5N6ZS98_9EURO|nr:uncharacterized protein BDV27DRAFT_50818 [Aspergillus caelatus]KAE8359719.1 hypothetical protein BDV27DRAFT_50818 [Aspergillus caelatus]KAE8410946.1 hypothetical protein BDV36DRAFT_104222 [Aspergillus pseudocaelatus]
MDRGGYIVFLILLSTMEWVSDRANCSPARFHLDAAKLIQLEADRSPTGATLISHLYVSSHSSSSTLFSWCYGSERRICDYSALCDFLFFFPFSHSGVSHLILDSCVSDYISLPYPHPFSDHLDPFHLWPPLCSQFIVAGSSMVILMTWRKGVWHLMEESSRFNQQ